MEQTAVVHFSKHGMIAQYAQWIADELSCALYKGEHLKPRELASFETLIIGGGLYAGKVNGHKWLKQHEQALADKRLALFTGGLADPEDGANTAQIRAWLAQSLPPELYARLALFHLRTGIDYAALGPLDKAMMAMMRRSLRQKDEQELTEEDRGLLVTYGGRVDFMEMAAIAPIVAWARQ